MTASIEKRPNEPQRVIIETVSPTVDDGRFPAKAIDGETIRVRADIFADGHDHLSALVLHRAPGEKTWSEIPMRPLTNDRWEAAVGIKGLGPHVFTLAAWADHFKTWRADLRKRLDAGQDITVDLQIGADLLRQAASRAGKKDAAALRSWASKLKTGKSGFTREQADLALSEEINEVMTRCPERANETRGPREYQIWAEPELARFGAWYELFPRSLGEKGRHGTFRDVEAHLPRVADMGFDVLYLPPIHPVGQAFRKGANNSTTAKPGEPGSPWGIGGKEGGHTAVHPELGTLEDFRRLVKKARRDHKIEIALDIAFQCSPDHPWVREHPDWFIHRPDGSIQYAENPPKKYQDIYPLNFESKEWKSLWRELRDVFLYWIKQGVTVFRVDNPHTKALPFWEWAIGEIKAKHPEIIFLSEAFTRPRILHYLAKAGFTQSYNYFPWRNTKEELTEFMEGLAKEPVRHYLRPNLWPNTPDILPQYLQYGGRPAFMIRGLLAATLGASYGIYGPAFELCVNDPREPGSEEYLYSEKYEIKDWNLDAPGNLTDFIKRLNRIRKENPALRTNDTLAFHPTDNREILAYSKRTDDGSNVLLMVVNLDPHHTQSGWVDIDFNRLGVNVADTYQVHELLSGARYLWQGSRNYVELDPSFSPAHVFRLRSRVRKENDFDYFM